MNIDSSIPRALSTSPSSPSPPPPHVADIENLTNDERIAIQDWLYRDPTYLTTICWNRYPRTYLLSPLWGYDEPAFREECVNSLMFWTITCGRRLSDPERDALLEPITGCRLACNLDRPIGFAAAAWLTARSWQNSKLRDAAAAARQQQQQKQAGGHVTHFSSAHQQHRQHIYGARSSLASNLMRRAARASAVGLACAIGYQALWHPWHVFWHDNEQWAIEHDVRLSRMWNEINNKYSTPHGDEL